MNFGIKVQTEFRSQRLDEIQAVSQDLLLVQNKFPTELLRDTRTSH